jgi:hypothetical protein
MKKCESEKMKKMTTYVVILLFIFSTVATIQGGHAALDNIKPGDTIYYKVSTYTLPLADLIPAGSSEVDLSKVQLDLTGSTIGVKVMQTFSTKGAYLLNAFAILGKDIVVPFPDSTPSTVTDIFGNDLTIPSGVGISIGTEIPGSSFTSFLNTATSDDYAGIPVYIEPASTADYKAKLDAVPVSSGMTLTTTDETDNFVVKFHAQDTNNTIDVSLTWTKTGDNAGLFTKFDLSGTVKNNAGTDVSIAFSFTFDHKDYNPLPDEILNKQQQTISIEDIGFDLTYSGSLFDEAFMSFNTTAYNELRSQILDLKGESILRYSILDVQGLYYETRMDTKNFDTNSFSTGSPVWFNGFTGWPMTSGYDSACAPGCSSGDFSGLGLIPLLAPGITPDWNIWEANYKTVSALSNIVTNTLTSSSVSSNLITLGLKVDQFTNKIEMRQKDQFRYFYGESDAKISYDASQADIANRPSGFDGTEKVNVEVSGNSWSSYSDTGLTAGYGLTFNATADLTNIPFNSTFRGDGSISLGLVVKLKNDAFTSVPNGSEASPVGGGGLLPGVPGFEFVPVFLVLVIIPLISRKRRNNI